MRKYTSTLAAFVTAGAICIALSACGSEGPQGQNGAPCSVTKNTDGSATITCPDGTTVTVPPGATGPGGEAGLDGDSGPKGDPGDSGVSCSIVDNGDGTKTITCTDGTKVTVSSALTDYMLLSSAEKEALDPTLKITDVKVPADGKPVYTLKITDRKGNPVKGMDSLTTGAGLTWRFSMLKLTPNVNGSANDTWVSYLAANATTSASSESANATTTAVAGQGTLKDNADGTYTYTFDKKITDATAAGTTYEEDKVHRVIALAYKTGNPFRPMNAWKDLIPKTGSDESGKNDKVNGDSCLGCHSDFRAPSGGLDDSFHGGSRYEIHVCVACHNDQRRFASTATGTAPSEPTMTSSTGGTLKWTGNASVINGESVLNFPVFVHKIHMGEELAIKPDRAGGGGGYSAVQFDEVKFPTDVRNCAKCHNTVAKADNWKSVPSRRSCNACHDGASFLATAPTGRVKHVGGTQTDDTKCTTCHAATDIAGFHVPVTKPNIITTGTLPASPDGQYVMSGFQPSTGKSCSSKGATCTGGVCSGGTSCSGASCTCTCTTADPCMPSANSNAAYIANSGVVPAEGAKITYEVSSVTIDSTTKYPKIVFKILKDGTAVDFGTYDATTNPELIKGFVGSPSVYMAWSLPQDGVTAPTDFNASASVYLKTLWNGTWTPPVIYSGSTTLAPGWTAGATTLTRDTTTGSYTLTVGLALPSSAKMFTAGIGYTYSMSGTQPLTQVKQAADVTKDLTNYAYNSATKIGGLIVPAPDVWKVATGYTARRPTVETARCNKCHDNLGTKPLFHSGQRNDGPTCSFCHNPNRVNSGWAVDASHFVHAIHGAGKRTTPYTWHGEIKAWEVGYPGDLNTCTQCHVDGAYDISASTNISQFANKLYLTAATGKTLDDLTLIGATNPTPATTKPFVSPWITPNTVDYGVGFSTSYQTSGTRGGVACSTSAPCVCSILAPCNAEDTTLVHSPITGVCSACHDSPVARKHFADNNGSFYSPRSVALAKPEQCLMCHGPGKVAAIKTVHGLK